MPQLINLPPPPPARVKGLNNSIARKSGSDMNESEDRSRQLAEPLLQLVWTCRVDGSCDYLSPQ